MTNRRLDALIAEHVYGSSVRWEKDRYPWVRTNPPDDFPAETLPHYSTDIALAIGLLEKLRADRDWAWAMHVAQRGMNVETFTGGDWITSAAPNDCIPEAICRHVLRVLGVEVPHD